MEAKLLVWVMGPPNDSTRVAPLVCTPPSCRPPLPSTSVNAAVRAVTAPPKSLSRPSSSTSWPIASRLVRAPAVTAPVWLTLPPLLMARLPLAATLPSTSGAVPCVRPTSCPRAETAPTRRLPSFIRYTEPCVATAVVPPVTLSVVSAAWRRWPVAAVTARSPLATTLPSTRSSMACTSCTW